MSRGNESLARIVPPLAVLALVIVAWAAYVRIAEVPAWFVPSPAAVLRSLLVDRGVLFPALGWTALAAIVGFLSSTLVGVLIALLLSASAVLRRALYPYTLFFQTVPIVAIAPMLIIWLGFGLRPVAVCAFIVSVFPVIANTLAGLLSTDPALVDLFRLYGARPIVSMWKLRLPSALPGIFTGLRIAAGLAVIGTVVAEFSVGQTLRQAGLGVVIVSAVKVSRTDRAFAGILLASLLGLMMFGAVNMAARLSLKRWHASEQ